MDGPNIVCNITSSKKSWEEKNRSSHCLEAVLYLIPTKVKKSNYKIPHKIVEKIL